MAKLPFASFLGQLRRLTAVARDDDRGDGALLERFVALGDEEAFAVLVRRHGPLVLDVCQRLLHNPHDAEDAFQATFLVLARKAGSIRKRESVGSWLYGVAYRISRDAKAAARRRRNHEQAAQAMSEANHPEALDCDLRPALDDALHGLPRKHRLPLVLCYLEGKSHEQAARELGCPPGSMSWRLERARKLLRRQLERSGLTLSVSVLALALQQSKASAVVRLTLEQETARAATAFALGNAATAGMISSPSLILANGALKAMFHDKLRTAAVMLLVLGAVSLGAGVVLNHALADRQPAELAVAAVTPGEVNPDALAPLLAPRARPIFAGKHEAAVAGVALSPDGQLVASAAGADMVRLWELGSGRVVRQIGEKYDSHSMHAVAFTPDGTGLAIGEGMIALRLYGVTNVFDLRDGKHRWRSSFKFTIKRLPTFSPDGKTLAIVAGGDTRTRGGIPAGSLHFHDAATGESFRSQHIEGVGIVSLAYSPDGGLLAVGCDDRTVRIRDAAGFKEQRRLDEEQPVSAVAFSPDGKLLASGTTAGSVRLWNVDTGRSERKLEGHASSVVWLGFVPPSGHLLASASEDGTVRMWETATGAALGCVARHKGKILSAALSRDGNLLATGGDDQLVLAWRTHQRIREEPLQPVALAAADLQQLWTDLASSDFRKSNDAIDRLVAGATNSLPFLKEHLRAEPTAQGKQIAHWIAALDSNRFEARQQAREELERLGRLAEPALRLALKDKPALEVVQRVEQLLARLTGPVLLTADQWRTSRAVDILEEIGTPEARHLLASLAQGPREAWLTLQAQQACDRLTRPLPRRDDGNRGQR